MTRPPTPPENPVAVAAVEALLAARWEVAELLSRRPSRVAADLLRGHAAELAMSALADDQLLSLALDRAAQDIEAGDPPLQAGVPFLLDDSDGLAGARESVGGIVLQQPGEPAPTPVHLAAEIERRLLDERPTPTELSDRLAAKARLQEALWNDPRLPAEPSVRLAMLCCIPMLAERAAELDPRPSGAHLRRPRIVLSASDHEQLQAIALNALLANPRVAGFLLEEIDRAEVLHDAGGTSNRVRVGSRVEYRDANRRETHEVLIVETASPGSDLELGVLTPLGVALIGLAAGQAIIASDRRGSEWLLEVLQVTPRSERLPTPPAPAAA